MRREISWVRVRISGQANQRQRRAGHAFAIVGEKDPDCEALMTSFCIIISHVLCM